MEGSCFIIVPGLSNPDAISLQAYNHPNFYVRHYNDIVFLSNYEDTHSFRDDATFYPRVAFINKVDYIEIDYVKDQMDIKEQLPVLAFNQTLHNNSPLQ